jgi:GAF domain-containing protein
MSSELSTVSIDRSIEQLGRELAEAREQQAATAEILKVISRSPTDLHGVFGEIAASAARLCDAYDTTIYRVEGDSLHLSAHHGSIPVGPVGQYKMTLVRGIVAARAALDRRAIQIADLQAEAEEYPEGSEYALRFGHRTILAVPLLRADSAIGVISVRRTEVRPFTETQIALLKTFADQAVIAIDNARLFAAEQIRTRELVERTHELTEALEYQTATSDVLSAISRTPRDLQPVLTEICNTASRLCDTADAVVFFRDGDWLKLGSIQGPIGIDVGKIALSRGYATGRAVLDRTIVHVQDLRAVADEYPQGYESSLKLGHRTIIAVPLIHNGESIGVLTLRRPEVRPFNEKQIKLLRTFADQAVIAIQNTRLFEEVQARNRDLTALGEVGRAVSSTLDLKAVLKTIVDRAVELSNTDGGSIYYFREHAGRFELGETTGLDEEVIARFH